MVLHLQISDDGVLHILLLFLQEVETHSVQCVGAQFIVPEENLRETRQSDCTVSQWKHSYLIIKSCCT